MTTSKHKVKENEQSKKFIANKHGNQDPIQLQEIVMGIIMLKDFTDYKWALSSILRDPKGIGLLSNDAVDTYDSKMLKLKVVDENKGVFNKSRETIKLERTRHS